MDHIPSQSYLLNQCTRNSDSSKFYNVSFISEEPGLSSFELSPFKYTEFQLDFINDYPDATLDYQDVFIIQTTSNVRQLV